LQPKKYTFNGKLPKPITLQEKKGTVIWSKWRQHSCKFLSTMPPQGTSSKDPVLTVCSCSHNWWQF
jgi:hypothetical protein